MGDEPKCADSRLEAWQLQSESQRTLINTQDISFEHSQEAVNKAPSVHVLGIPMHKMSRPVQFVLCFSGIVIFYLLCGVSQEWIFRIKGFKLFGAYQTLIQFCYYSLFGVIEKWLLHSDDTQRRIPMTTYILIAFLTVASMGLADVSLGYLNYPTQIIFKSCKLIPVMIGGVFIQGKKYTMLDYTATSLLCIGLVLFNLADASVIPNMDKTGILLITLSLCADAIIGNVQEKAMKQYSASTVEIIIFSYSIGILYLLLWTAVSGILVPAFHFCLEHPEIYLMASVLSVSGYIGVNFILATINYFGALTVVTVTTFRKTLTVVLSFLFFTKPFTQQYVWAGLVVLLGIALNIYSKNFDKVNKWLNILFLRKTSSTDEAATSHVLKPAELQNHTNSISTSTGTDPTMENLQSKN